MFLKAFGKSVKAAFVMVEEAEARRKLRRGERVLALMEGRVLPLGEIDEDPRGSAVEFQDNNRDDRTLVRVDTF